MNSTAETVASAAVSAFSGNENKALLWSVLHGGGKFVGIPDNQVTTIKEMFESTIHNIGEHCRRLNQPVNLNAINKEAVVIICKKIEAIKMQQQSQEQRSRQQQQIFHQKKQQQIPQLETIYRAEDVQKERQNAFQAEFKKKEEEMSSILKLKKPEEINFTDDVYDKPIGGDMERLIAEALASRERELEQIKNVAFAAQPPPPLPLSDSYNIDKTVIKGENAGIEKRVSFETELHVIENRHQNDSHQNDSHQNDSHQNDSGYGYENENNDERATEIDEPNDESDISFIFNKLKKIKTQKNNERQNENNENSQVIIKMSQDIEYIKTALAELLEKVNKL
jgi:hypothetical protein